MRNNPKPEYRVGVGASSILMVLMILALTAISLLAYSSARNAEILTNRNTAMTRAYYQAANQVQQKLAALDTMMIEKRNETSPVDAESLRQSLQDLGLADIQISAGNENWEFLFYEDAGYERQIRVEGVLMLSGSSRFLVRQHELESNAVADDYDEFLLFGE